MGKRCLAYLAYVKVVSQKYPSLEDIRVAREFMNVLPTNLPIAPLDRDIDFANDVEPDTKPIPLLFIGWLRLS